MTHPASFFILVACFVSWPPMTTFAVEPKSVSSSALVIEDLGTPLLKRELGLRCVTKNAEGVIEAWGAFETMERFALVGVRIDTGKTTFVDVSEFGPPPTRARHPQMMTGNDGHLYAFVGSPGHFVKFDVSKRTLTDLGVPSKRAGYWLGAASSADGKFYLGTASDTELVRCDTATGKIENLGRLSLDPNEHYAPHPVVADDGIVYCPVGLHHGELWAFNPATNERKQILPAALLTKQGAPEVWRAKDGRVYGKWADVNFRCTPDAIVEGETQPFYPRANSKQIGDLVVGDVDDAGKLKLTRGNKASFIATDYPGATRAIYSVSCERDGIIYGGGVSPSHTFSFDPKSKKLTDLGQFASGPVQVYDTLSHERGLFIASYMNASVDFFDPAAPMKKGENPRHIVTLPDQERPAQEIIGPDGLIYVATSPSKGRLGGTLLRVSPAGLTHRVWNNIVPNQSIARLVSVPKTGEVLGVSNVSGGSSATPTEKEAELFLWDCKQEKIVFTTKPLPNAKALSAVVLAPSGIVYGVEGRANRYFAFDPGARKTIFTGSLPVKSLRFPDLADEPFGPRHLIYGIGDDAVFAIDPSDHNAKVLGRDARFKDAYGFFIAHDGWLYFGRLGHLMRCKLPESS